MVILTLVEAVTYKSSNKSTINVNQIAFVQVDDNIQIILYGHFTKFV